MTEASKAEAPAARRSPLWLRVVAGITILPFVWFAFGLLATRILAEEQWGRAVITSFFAAIVMSWIIVRKLATAFCSILSIGALVSYGLAFGLALSVSSCEIETPDQPQLPFLPWPPPAASATYVLPDHLFEKQATLGDVIKLILSALERNGYVERSFFGTEIGGVALVTRLERINEDGSSFREDERWPGGVQTPSGSDLFRFLRGLFFVDPGHYRVIVFILQDVPFTQSGERITQEDALAWLRSGANVLPPEIARRTFSGSHCTVLIYEFASDGTTVRVIGSRLTGKQHLERAGVLSLLENPI
jgi:hypothetical protein